MVAMKDIRVVARERVREPSRSPPERRTGVPATCASLRARPHDRSRLLANPTVIASNSGGLAMSSPKHVGRTGSRWLRTAAAGGLARHRHRSVLRFLRTAGCRAPGSGPHPSSEPRGARLSRPSEAPTVSDRPVNRAPRPGRLRGSLTLALAICRHFVAAGDRQHHAAALLLFLATLALAAPAAAQTTDGAGSTAERDSDRRRRGRVAGMVRIARPPRHVSVPSCVGLLGAGEHELAPSPDSAERDQWLSVGTRDRTDQRRGLCVRDAQEGRPEHQPDGQPDGQRDGYADGHILPGAQPHGAKAGLDRFGHDGKQEEFGWLVYLSWRPFVRWRAFRCIDRSREGQLRDHRCDDALV